METEFLTQEVKDFREFQRFAEAIECPSPSEAAVAIKKLLDRQRMQGFNLETCVDMAIEAYNDESGGDV